MNHASEQEKWTEESVMRLWEDSGFAVPILTQGQVNPFTVISDAHNATLQQSDDTKRKE